MHHHVRVLLSWLSLAAACSISPACLASPGGSGGVNAAAQQDQPYLILVSIDGYRWDYLAAHPTPALAALKAGGVSAESLRPVYPTLTFPNHYSIATGQYPVEHGIVANDFPAADGNAWYSYKERDAVQDGRWYGGEPIWVAAERAGIVSAAYFFVGTEAPVDGISPTHWYPFDASVPGAARVERTLDWLAEPAASRPHLVTLYFEDLDEASHRYGPGSPESVAALGTIDGYLRRLLDGIEALPFHDDVYVVVVSDHGQSSYRPGAEPFVLDEFLDLDGIVAVDSGSLTNLYLQDGDAARAARIVAAINERWAHGHALRPADAPAAWRLTAAPRIADVIVQAQPGYGVLSTRERNYKITPGAHGWPPEFRDMHGIFIARGPGLPAGQSVGIIEAVEIYPLLLDVFCLPDRRPTRHPSALAALIESHAAACARHRDSDPREVLPTGQ